MMNKLTRNILIEKDLEFKFKKKRKEGMKKRKEGRQEKI